LSDDRTTYIGGPGAATILGVNPYQTQVELWQFLTKRAPPIEANDEMKSGLRLERAVLDYASEKLGKPVLPGPFVRDVRLPILGGHLDGITEGSMPELIEAKTVRGRRDTWGEAMSVEIPPGVVAQAMHYLGLVPELRVAWVPVLFSGLQFEMFGAIERNEQLIEQMRNICWRWWQDYVVKDIPPPASNAEDVLRLFPRDSGRVVLADEPTAEALVKLRAVKEQISALEIEKKAHEERIKMTIGDATAIALVESGEIAATWKTTKPALVLDEQALKSARPDVFIEFAREQTQRRFLLK
jgi:putative phage-type endonuclease